MSNRMIRKQIYLEPEQEARLRELSARLGLSESALIRRGIDLTLRAVPSPLWSAELWQKELDFARSLTPVNQARDWTRDELYDR
ncbi:MAG: ribbon-helix-helix domain-containing protein [Candidatus Eremiobacterota bacterium]